MRNVCCARTRDENDTAVQSRTRSVSNQPARKRRKGEEEQGARKEARPICSSVEASPQSVRKEVNKEGG